MKKNEFVFNLYGLKPDAYALGWMHIGVYHNKSSMINYIKSHSHMFVRFCYFESPRFLGFNDVPDIPTEIDLVLLSVREV